jgi:flagellar hook protein FlgE
MGIETIANTGMQAAMSNMEVISNNIANSNTLGFKKSYANFADLFPSGNSSSGAQAGLGVSLSSIQQDFTSGGIQTTGQTLDLSIKNNSFFMMKDPTTGVASFTRAGRFDLDSNGYIINGNQRLQGFQAVNGTIVAPSTADLQIPSAPMPAKATATSSGSINLDSNATVPTTTFSDADPTSYNFSTNTTVYDSLGNPNKLTLYYVKAATTNTWVVNTEVNGVASGTGTMTFSQGGALTSSTGLNSLTFSPTTGATSPQTVSMNLANSTQYGGNGSQVIHAFSADGYQSGTLSGISVDSNGIVYAQYTNQQKMPAGQIALAQFQSPEGLSSAGNSSWTANSMSGNPIVNQSNSSGNLFTGAVELSNVDLTQEMVNLIGAQHSFQANAQVEQTYNEVMQTIIKL